eukprot:TRINITY_DN1586_c0_g1_i1.p1 TRINITY_DN1586_c0_g1~~TRINITY_DN1586_c0_g1_i1.p1  ORF type:complete len:625 (+),score=223.40 TRINITY_DN1586_c0_g1_i1:84-1958(+)
MSQPQPQPPTCGIEFDEVPELPGALYDAQDKFIDFIMVPISRSGSEKEKSDNPSSFEPFTHPDMLLNSSQWSSSVVGKVSATAAALDSADASVRRAASERLQQEVGWASHLSLPAILMPPPGPRSANYIQYINQVLQSNAIYMQVWLRVPLVAQPATATADADEGAEQQQEQLPNGRMSNEPWEWWDSVRTLCDSHSSLHLALEITEDLPSAAVLARWLAEPVKAVILPSSIFLSNKAGYPVLSKRHQDFVQRLMQFKVRFIVQGAAQHPEGASSYVQYVHWLASRVSPPSELEQFEGAYRDYLQAPLQPLQDNLESQTYEVFERDATKYSTYEQAVHQALLTKPAGETVVLMVVGAGRGPLVRASLRAGLSAQRTLRVYAVEKNPNAVITLQMLKRTLGWGDQVTIVDSDMRHWKAPEQADVLVSELLGSFGDNELSPECLDGAQAFLKPDGVSIPAAYTSFLAPITSAKLHNEVRNFKDMKHLETPYVVKMHQVAVLAAAQPVFTFVHPNRSHPIDNGRYATLSFTVEDAATVHGLAGYFDATLFGDVHLSIHPPTHTPNMFSWFPLFFPLRTPVHVPRGGTVQVHIWRLVSKYKVWYEWTVSSPQVLPIHNPGGRSYFIGI